MEAVGTPDMAEDVARLRSPLKRILARLSG
jgi:hypothetical protein